MGNTDNQSRFGARCAAVLIGLMMLSLIGGCSRPPECLGAESTVGIALPLDGVTEIKSDGQAAWERPAEATCLELGDAVRTLEGGGAAMFFADGSRILLAPDTEAVVVAFTLGADYRVARLALDRGTLTYDIASLEFPISTFQILTPGAVLSVIGTIGQITVEPGGQVISTTLIDGTVGDAILAGPTVTANMRTALMIIDLVPGVQVISNIANVEPPEIDMLIAAGVYTTTLQATNTGTLLESLGLSSGALQEMLDNVFGSMGEYGLDARLDILQAILGNWTTVEITTPSPNSDAVGDLADQIMSHLLSATSDPEIATSRGVDVVYIRQTEEARESDSGKENPYGYQLEALSGISIAEAEVGADDDAERLLEIMPPWDFGLDFSTAPAITPPGGLGLPTLVETTAGTKREGTSISSPASPCPQLSEGGCEVGRQTPTSADSLRATPSPTNGAPKGDTPDSPVPSATPTSTPCQSLTPGGCATATPK